MSNMRDIKRRIRSVKNTQQITRAMHMIAAAKLRKARENVDTSKDYFEKMNEIVKDAVTRVDNTADHPLLEKRDVKNVGYIVITADRGLCGGYNSNVIKKATELIKRSNEESKLLVVGQKGRDYFRRQEENIIAEYLKIDENINYGEARNIALNALEMYRHGVYDELHLVYTQFITTLSQKPVATKLLPVEAEDEVRFNKISEEEEQFIYEPSPEGVLDIVIPKFIEASIFGALLESKASELSARMTAMDNATENAEELIGSLTLSYNRARQASITKEISEIVGGAEALRG